jgi:hypothetical protein
MSDLRYLGEQTRSWITIQYIAASGHDRCGERVFASLLRSDTPERHRFDSPSWEKSAIWRRQVECRLKSAEHGSDRDVGMKLFPFKALMSSVSLVSSEDLFCRVGRGATHAR